MHKLPFDIKRLIFQYMDIKTFALCNKKYWISNYKLRLTKINKNIFEKYARFLIKNDYSFIFDLYCKFNLRVLVKKKKVYYHNKLFYNKIEWLRYLSQFCNAKDCLENINDIIKTERLVFKNIKLKKNKWTN